LKRGEEEVSQAQAKENGMGGNNYENKDMSGCFDNTGFVDGVVIACL
jgi:hypothetical protein